MAAYQYVYHMQGVSKTYPGGKKCFENIHLSFLPGVKIGVVGTRVGVAEVGTSVGRFDGVGVGFVVGDNDWSVGFSEGI